MTKTDKKEDIIQAAIHEFLENGLRKTSMQAIASSAQVSKRTLYKYYSNKQDLYQEITNRLLKELEMSSLDEDILSHLPFEIQVEKLIENAMDFITQPKNLILAKLVISESLKSNPMNIKTVKQFREQLNVFQSWVDDNQKAGNIKQDFAKEMITEFFDGLLTGVVLFPILLGEKEEFKPKDIKIYSESIKKVFMASFCI